MRLALHRCILVEWVLRELVLRKLKPNAREALMLSAGLGIVQQLRASRTSPESKGEVVDGRKGWKRLRAVDCQHSCIQGLSARYVLVGQRPGVAVNMFGHDSDGCTWFREGGSR